MIARAQGFVLVAVGAAMLASSASAIAATATSDGRVFRYRAIPGERVVVNLAQFNDGSALGATHLAFSASAPFTAGSGCQLASTGPRLSTEAPIGVLCPLVAPTDFATARYRLSLSGGDDKASSEQALSGVIYAGAGDDITEGGYRVYGGPGDDILEGYQVYGGPGGDSIAANEDGHGNLIAHGGRGDDRLMGPGRLYGGPGDDYLTDSHRDFAMLVGGAGTDHIDLLGDELDDVVRVRGGGIDTVRCLGAVDRYDVLYLDAVDHVQSSCRKARIVLTGRPRLPL